VGSGSTAAVWRLLGTCEVASPVRGDEQEG
jgi:hypothetical protein